MTEQKIEDKLKSGFEKITPDVLNSVLEDCRTQNAGSAQILTMEHKRQKRPALRFAGIAAALLLLVGGWLGFRTWQVNSRVASVISLDVNPSVEIRTNEKEKVLEVIPLNEDGRIIAGDMDFSGSSLDVAVNALVGSMLRNGYLSELANSILISIDNDDPAAAAALEQKLMSMVNGLLGDAHLEGAVLGQVVNRDQTAEDLAKSFGISVGKARLIEILMAADPRYTAEELSRLSINELNNLYASHRRQSGSQEDKDPIDSIGKASTQAYIGEEAAIQAALKDAGVGEDSVRARCGLDWEDGCMVYEVEFTADGTEFEYGIDARTGEIVSVEKESADDDDDRDDDEWDDDDGRDKESSPAAPEESSAADEPSSSGLISKEKARLIALEKAGVSADKIRDYSIETETEDGKTVYEVEFCCGDYEYSLTIDAATGRVLEFEREKDD